MKKIHRVFALLMAAIMALSLITTAFAEPTIDPAKKASLSIYKYDITTASSDGAWDTESYVSTGLHDDAIVDKLSKYAIQGVEFTYLRVADVTMNNEVVDDQRTVGVLYGFDSSERSNAVLSAIGLTASDTHKSENGINYYTSDSLNNELSAALAANATTVKNALESAVKDGGVAMTETDATGHTFASDMEQGLYLVVETRVPENVTSTCNPFFVSLPMTTIDGAAWNYDVTVYPKNQTGNPDLEKTVREAKNSTGKHNGSLTDIGDGYAHTASASIGDTVDYQIISTLPTITSKASSLSEYTYVDTMSKGIRYNKNDVVIEFFKDVGCTDKITTWAEDSGKFTVAYDDAQNIMTIRMTDTGLREINEAATVYVDSVKRGYSDCTMRVTYAATLTADAATYGDRDNPNKVKLTWKRTNTTYYDTLEDCCHVYVYAIDLIKQFSDNNGTFGKVKFIAYNDTDGYYIKANMEGEVYNVTGFTSNKSEATMLIPNLKGHIILRGIEDDTYTLTEVATDKGYVLLRDPVKVVVTTKEDGTCERCGAALLTASATVNGEPVSMTDANAVVPLRIINNPGFDLPKTGGYGVWMYTVGGVMAYVDIPKIGVYLPVQHGTDADTLERAVGHVIGTSLPVGGNSTHAVLSAHSGMASAKLFSDIDQLATGDTFYIHVLGEVLAYKVDAINTVLPTDTRLLQIEDGKDYVTLVTCTPFGVNTHRLLVRGHRVPYTPEQETTAVEEKSTASSWMQHYLTGLAIGLGAAAVVGGAYFLVRGKRHA